jgi:hypothetical protein
MSAISEGRHDGEQNKSAEGRHDDERREFAKEGAAEQLESLQKEATTENKGNLRKEGTIVRKARRGRKEAAYSSRWHSGRAHHCCHFRKSMESTTAHGQRPSPCGICIMHHQPRVSENSKQGAAWDVRIGVAILRTKRKIPRSIRANPMRVFRVSH